MRACAFVRAYVHMHDFLSLVSTQPDMKCYTEEIFGPVLVIVNADTLDDVSVFNTLCAEYGVYYSCGR